MNRERKFTPGPWEAYNNDQHIDDEFILKFYAVRPVGGANILRLSGTKENQANANLIAAAPELLKELESHCQACMERNNFENGCHGCYTQRAIQKAYGETE